MVFSYQGELSRIKQNIIAFLLLLPMFNHGQWLVNELYYGGDKQVVFSGERFSVWSLNDSTLAYRASTSRKSLTASDVYASYGTISKDKGYKISSYEAPELDRSAMGTYVSWVLPSFELGLGLSHETEINYVGLSLKSTIGCFSLSNNEVLWKLDGRLTANITPFILRQSDTIIWMQKGSPWDSTSYLVCRNARNGDSLASLPTSSFYPRNLDSNFFDYELRRSVLANDTFFVEFESVNFHTRNTLGYPTGRKWIKAYDPGAIENGAIDSIFYPDYNLDKALLRLEHENDGLLFYEYHDSIASALADSGVKTFFFYNWKKKRIKDMALKLKVSRNPNSSNWPEFLQGTAMLQNNFTLVISPHLYGPTKTEYNGTRLVLFDSTGTIMYDIVTDTTRPSWTMSDFYIDKNGNVYFQGTDPNNYNFSSLGRILPNGQNARVLPLGIGGSVSSPEDFQIFPNPVISGGTIEISILNGFEPAQIEIYDSAGNLCFADNGQLDSRISLPNNLSAGVYSLIISKKGKADYQKLLIIP